ncbi:hypothetical protein P872_25470 [Rhodonellum psychrophilum GCM71 = DSM 17998]|uniref:Outer membrane protein beta-barrel domain-containing protein n=2 Tax=Rhodonellum TaxID=336827 RepID=U5C3X2_9BACT|nr:MULTISPECIES: hypothetical protein [Rhodonellum]ERM84509.1 hypothetical protein P872_25470 [Rhodonellum psychrophilum GCM71 = DSM 17998]SDZ01696.1 hypothetical protein SAMN05444412_104323 [Rhodonellum ikkaensis]
MNKIFTLTLIVFFGAASAFAQIKYVNFDVVGNTVNEGNPMPAEEPFYIKGTLPQGIEFVKVKVFESGKSPSKGDEYSWKTAFEFKVNQYELFVSKPLKSNDSYDLEFQYFQKADEAQMESVKSAVNMNLASYIRSSFEVTGSGIKSFRSDQVMITQMNQILKDALEDYRHFLGRDFSGFSDLVRQKLAQKDKMKLRRAKFNILGKNKDDNSKAVYAEQYLEELVETVTAEADQYLAKSLMALVDVRTITNYPTEKKPGTLPINFGYGAFAIKRSLADTEYFNGPYLGLSFPLGNKVFQKFLGNASFSTGVFLNNFNSSQGDRITGPLVNLPIHAGLGYKMFRVLRLNAGAVLLNFEEADTKLKTNYIQPYVGVSLEINLWMGLNDRR